MGTMVRHAFCDAGSRDCRSAQPVSPLAISMVESAFYALLVSAPCCTPLLESATTPTNRAAVTLSPVAVCADEEEGAAICSLAKSLTENGLSVGCHRPEQRALDSQRPMMATYTPLIKRWVPRQRGHQRKTPVVHINRGLYSRLAPHTIKSQLARKPPSAMILILV